ncbi:MAG: hypothetical protein JWO04_748 [Gammaproteobacteria bacterium]|nr:hypothetical protein [Gammaproteobacteria bacterium]
MRAGRLPGWREASWCINRLRDVELESAPRCRIGSIALGGAVRNSASQVFPAQRSRPRGEEQHSSNIERPVSALGSPSRRQSRQEPVKFCE